MVCLLSTVSLLRLCSLQLSTRLVRLFCFVFSICSKQFGQPDGHGERAHIGLVVVLTWTIWCETHYRGDEMRCHFYALLPCLASFWAMTNLAIYHSTLLFMSLLFPFIFPLAVGRRVISFTEDLHEKSNSGGGKRALGSCEPACDSPCWDAEWDLTGRTVRGSEYDCTRRCLISSIRRA